jgi:type II restriction/modification system DNA methylase subunit YeeA
MSSRLRNLGYETKNITYCMLFKRIYGSMELVLTLRDYHVADTITECANSHSTIMSSQLLSDDGDIVRIL